MYDNGAMTLDPDFCYRVLQAHDARFDGRFFVAVRTTGIYCRPVCRVRVPRRENCRYFASAAAAEQGGFRPCLRCRPELAPGFAAVDAGNRLAQRAAAAVDAGDLDDGSLAGVARRLGTTDRHLRRVFGEQFGVSPVQYAQTRRRLLAKQLLTDTTMPVTEVAFASGFGSLRRFNAVFASRYRLTPGQLRRRSQGSGSDHLEFRLAYREPYDWPRLLAFLERRSIDGVESVESGVYRRTIRIDGQHGWLSVRPLSDRPALRVDLSPSLGAVVSRVLARVRRICDLDGSPSEVAAVLGELAAGREGLRVPGAVDGFEVAVRAVLGQQITVKAARTLAGRFARAFGEVIDTPFVQVDTLFPDAARIAALEVSEIASLGIIGNRARTILALARAIADGRLRLDPSEPADETIAVLTGLPGIGDWTAQYIAMRALSWPDAFPAADHGVMKALAVTRPAAAIARAERWRPWRAYAVMHLWTSLE